MCHPTDVHELQKYCSAVAVNFVGHQTPAPPLGFRVNARHHCVAFAGGSDIGYFGDNQASTGPLCIITSHETVRNIAAGRPCASHGRHNKAVFQRNSPVEGVWFEHVCHRFSFGLIGTKVYCGAVIPIYTPIGE